MTTEDMLDYTKAIETKVKLATLREVLKTLRAHDWYDYMEDYLKTKIKEAEK